MKATPTTKPGVRVQGQVSPRPLTFLDLASSVGCVVLILAIAGVTLFFLVPAFVLPWRFWFA